MRVLVTGGAGFIGSHLADALLARGDEVRVLDDLSTGSVTNVPDGAELLVGSVTDGEAVRRGVAGVELVFHEAALGSVRRSVDDPITTHDVNASGTLCILQEALAARVRRVVFASSSSVYGGAEVLPTPEQTALKPRSPYAVSKLAAEHYCRVFSELYRLETVSLRYFNVFGPRQRVDSRHGAVIPLFLDALQRGYAPTVFGDGRQSRDFTFVNDVARANMLAGEAEGSRCAGRAYNIGAGQLISVLEVLDAVASALGVEPQPVFEDPRPGDVLRSQADPSAAQADLGFTCRVPFRDGVRRTVETARGQPASAG